MSTLFKELTDDLYEGERDYVGVPRELYPLKPSDPDYKPMMAEFNKQHKDLLDDAIGSGEEWLVDERYQLVYDLLIKYGFATGTK